MLIDTMSWNSPHLMRCSQVTPSTYSLDALPQSRYQSLDSSQCTRYHWLMVQSTSSVLQRWGRRCSFVSARFVWDERSPGRVRVKMRKVGRSDAWGVDGRRPERLHIRACISVCKTDEKVNEGRPVDFLFHPTSSDLQISIQVDIRRERKGSSDVRTEHDNIPTAR